MERGALAPEDRIPFFAHIDEFQTFSSDAFASLLSEARKFALHFALANQFTAQLSQAVRAAVIGNAGTLIVFRVGSPRRRSLRRHADALLGPMDAVAGDLASQEPFTAWLRRGIDRDRIFVEPKLYRAARYSRSDPRAEPAALRPLSWRDRAATSNALLNPRNLLYN